MLLFYHNNNNNKNNNSNNKCSSIQKIKEFKVSNKENSDINLNEKLEKPFNVSIVILIHRHLIVIANL